MLMASSDAFLWRRRRDQLHRPGLQLVLGRFAPDLLLQPNEHQVAAAPARDAHLIQRRELVSDLVRPHQGGHRHRPLVPGGGTLEDHQFTMLRLRRHDLVAR
jgi:hypothetical protein